MHTYKEIPFYVLLRLVRPSWRKGEVTHFPTSICQGRCLPSYSPLQWRIQDFPEVAEPSRGRQHMILPKLPKNCMKLNEFGPEGPCVPRAPHRSANALYPGTMPHCLLATLPWNSAILLTDPSTLEQCLIAY